MMSEGVRVGCPASITCSCIVKKSNLKCKNLKQNWKNLVFLSISNFFPRSVRYYSAPDDGFFPYITSVKRYVVMNLVEVLHCKPEGCGFDYR
jgi:hypothetical protein